MGTYNSRFFLAPPPSYGIEKDKCYFTDLNSDKCRTESFMHIIGLIAILLVCLSILIFFITSYFIS
jgi:hypothetical protein